MIPFILIERTEGVISNQERIEIITNPSSKFDSEGTSGIINIILKSNKKKGWNSTLVAGIGTNNKYNGSASYSYVKNKFAFSSTYGYRYNENWRSAQSDRKNFYRPESRPIAIDTGRKNGFPR
jgi:outer membrane cobalamin receptor